MTFTCVAMFVSVLVGTQVALAQSAGATQVTSPGDLNAESWPQTVTTDTGSAIVYQPPSSLAPSASTDLNSLWPRLFR